MSRKLAIPSLLGIVLTIVWPVLFVPAAGATDQTAFTIQVDRPGDGATISGSSTVTASGRVSAGLGALVESVRVQVVRDSDGAVVSDSTGCCGSPQPGDSPWGPVTSSKLSFNGPYHLVVTATGYYDILLSKSPAPAAQVTQTFAVAVPPAAPENVKASVGADRRVSLSWDAVPSYPDFLGYAVYRKASAAGYAPIAAITNGSTSFTDTPPADAVGTISYQVASVRQGAAPGNNPDQWLVSKSDASFATLPAIVTTTVPGQTTTSNPPGGGLQQGGAASQDLGSFFGSVPTFTVPPTTPPPTLPDTGFNQTLPFPATTAGGKDSFGKVSGRQAGKSSSASGTGDISTRNASSDSNRRALLVPVAGGSVLCVAALHLRWFTRRLAVPVAAKAGGRKGKRMGAEAEGVGLDLQPEEFDHDAFLSDRPTVGAGRL